MKIEFANACYVRFVCVIATSIAIGFLAIINPQMIFAQGSTAASLNKSLEKTWETPNQLKNPESVAYDSSKAYFMCPVSMVIQMAKTEMDLFQRYRQQMVA